MGLSIENSMLYILEDLLKNNFDLIKEVIEDLDYINEEEKEYSINYLKNWVE